MKQFITVHKHAKLSENNLWDTVRDETAGILDRNQIKFTSIDLVRFRWHHKPATSPVTIWIGVLPKSTNTNAAFECAQHILRLLKRYGIDDVDIAFRESVARPFSITGPILYSPVSRFHPLQGVIDWVTTALSLPIAGLDSPDTEGTLGFYFKDGEDLYGVTARHVLFPATEGNDAYTYNTSALKTNRKKYVSIMGTQAFKNLLESVEEHIKQLTSDVTSLESRIPVEAKWAQSRNQSPEVTSECHKRRDKIKGMIIELENFLETLTKDWSHIDDRIIGHVVWSPPISGINPGSPRGFTRDLCVIKLNKKKVLPNCMGNVIDIGKPNIPDTEGHPTRFVFRSGGRTQVGTTLGLLNGFLSRVRRYTPLGNIDSVEVAIFPYDKGGIFSQASDSGAAIVGSNNEFVAQLTAGTGSSESCDITYTTPMDWLWRNVIKPEFPDASLFFDALSPIPE